MINKYVAYTVHQKQSRWSNQYGWYE